MNRPQSIALPGKNRSVRVSKLDRRAWSERVQLRRQPRSRLSGLGKPIPSPSPLGHLRRHRARMEEHDVDTPWREFVVEIDA